ncbi:MAG: hypothetical protein R3F30_02540 [Planctomycetota bacterium]
MTGRRRPPARPLLLAALGLGACAAPRVPAGPAQGAAPLGRAEVLAEPAWSRMSSTPRRDEGTARFDLAFEAQDPGDRGREALRFVNRIGYDVDPVFRARFEWQPLTWVDDASGDRSASTTGDVVLGVDARLLESVQPLSESTVVDVEGGLDLFGVIPTGQPKPPRWPGVIESEEGLFMLGNLRAGSRDRGLGLDLGGGLAGLPGSTSRTGRLLGGLSWTEGLGLRPGDLGLDGARLGVGTFWTHDFGGHRSFGELSVHLTLAIETVELDFGFRAGLTPESPDRIFTVMFGTRLFDVFW